jgi:hypothetical protein
MLRREKILISRLGTRRPLRNLTSYHRTSCGIGKNAEDDVHQGGENEWRMMSVYVRPERMKWPQVATRVPSAWIFADGLASKFVAAHMLWPRLGWGSKKNHWGRDFLGHIQVRISLCPSRIRKPRSCGHHSCLDLVSDTMVSRTRSTSTRPGTRSVMERTVEG